jgi:L-alanine-DL-glutamate epimerase-like enolase superfamily enzyme
MAKPAMLIEKISLDAVSLPLAQPLRTSIHEIRQVYCLLASVHTNLGIVGEGYAFCFGETQLRAIAQMTSSISSRFLQRDPHDIEAIWSEVFRANNFYGQAGVAILAVNPLDVACWDLIGKAADRPLYKLFGACRDRVPVYASGGLWLSSSVAELEREAKAFVSAGFKAMKLRIGSKRWQDDVDRVAAVRNAIGEDVHLMVDVNQGLGADDALRLGRALDGAGLAWFEEPVPTWNDAASAAISARLDTPVASGETEYTRYGIKRLVERQCADIYMPDLQRMGGYTEMRKVIHYLAAHDLPVAPHIFTEHSLHLVASAANATWCEHMPWFEPLFHERMVVDADGMVALPQRAGVGFTFDWDAIAHYRIAL